MAEIFTERDKRTKYCGEFTASDVGTEVVVNGWVQLDQYGYGKTIATAAADWINENLDGKANIVIMSEDWL